MEISDTESVSPKRSRLRLTLNWGGWILFGLILLLFFTVVNLSDTRLKGLIENQLQTRALALGLQITTQETSFSFLMGLRLKLKGVQVKPFAADRPMVFDTITATPIWSALLSGRVGLDLVLEKKPGTIRIHALGSNRDFKVKLDIDQFDLAATAALESLAKIKGRGILSGTAEIDGNPINPATWAGFAKLKGKAMGIDAQNVQGFTVPQISISEGELDSPITQGKISLKTLKLGKPADDLFGSMTGDILLNASIPDSKVNLSTTFSFSKKVLDAFPILDAVLGMGKQPNGSYGFQLTGPLAMPFANPIAPH